MTDAPHKPRKRKALLVIGGIVLALILILTGTSLWLQHKVRGMIENELSDTYKITVGNVKVSLVGRSVRIRDLKVSTAPYGLGPNDSMVSPLEASLAELSATGIGFKRQDGKYRIRIGSLTLRSPGVSVNRSIDSLGPNPNRGSGDGILKSVSVNNIRIENGNLRYNQWKHGVQTILSAEDFQLGAESLCLDATLGENMLPCQRLWASLVKATVEFPEKKIVLTADSLALDTRGGLLAVSSFGLLPQLPEYEYAAQVKGHPDWTQITTGSVACRGIDFPLLFSEKVLRMDSLTIERAKVRSYKNRQLPQEPHIKKLFFTSVQRFPLKIDIPLTTVSHLDATYEELSAKGSAPGVVTFKNLHARIDNLTNIIMKEKPWMTVTARCELLGEASLQATFKLPVDSTMNHFDVSGSMGRLSLPMLNETIAPLANLKIESGEAKSMDFRISGTLTQSRVEMVFLYDDLSVVLLKDKDLIITERKFLSRLLDKVILRPDNPDRGKTHTGTGTFDRDPYKSQFNYLWKSLLPGIKNTVMR